MSTTKRKYTKQDKASTYRVYWLHDDVHTDMYKDGYCGVTKQKLVERLAKHRYDANVNERDKPVSVWMRSSMSIKMDLLFEGTYEQCMRYELKLRPMPNIGLNVYSGGHKGRLVPPSKVNIHNNEELAAKQRSGLEMYQRRVAEIRRELKISYKEAREVYKERFGLNHHRVADKVREYAKLKDISFSDARRELSGVYGEPSL